MEDEETLEPCALIGELADPIQNKIDDFLPDGVVAAGVVICGIFLACNQLLWVEELSVGPCTDFICGKGTIDMLKL